MRSTKRMTFLTTAMLGIASAVTGAPHATVTILTTNAADDVGRAIGTTFVAGEGIVPGRVNR